MATTHHRLLVLVALTFKVAYGFRVSAKPQPKPQWVEGPAGWTKSTLALQAANDAVPSTDDLGLEGLIPEQGHTFAEEAPGDSKIRSDGPDAPQPYVHVPVRDVCTAAHVANVPNENAMADANVDHYTWHPNRLTVFC